MLYAENVYFIDVFWYNYPMKRAFPKTSNGELEEANAAKLGKRKGGPSKSPAKLTSIILRITLYALLFAGGAFSALISSFADNARPSEEETIIKSSTGVYGLYYNTLLVSDQVDLSKREPDSEIALPHTWFGVKEKSGGSLPFYGYASYLTQIELSAGTRITFKKEPVDVAFAVYVEGEKIAGAGTVGKSFSESSPGFSYQTDEVYEAKKSGKANVIIEVGYNFVGGLSFAPKFYNVSYHDSEQNVVTSLSYIVLVCYLALFVVELVSYFRIYDSTIYTVNMAGSLFFMALFSPLMNSILMSFGCYLPPFIFGIIGFLFFCLFLLSILQFFQYTYRSKLPTKLVALGVAFAGLATILYASLIPLRLPIVAYGVYALVYIYLLIKISYFSKLKNQLDITGVFTKCVFYSVLGMELCIVSSCSSLFPLSSSKILLAYLFLVIVLFLAIYVAFIVRTYRHAMNELKSELQNKDLRLLVLRDQIKPHFVFNCLGTIKALYHQDEGTGDRAVSLLADYLRYAVDVSASNLISFEKELDNVYNFVELKNLRTEKRFEVLYDIDVQDFEVPVLSIEPFVENAIKYSKVNEKEGGRIEISTYQDETSIYVEISDNGVGFDSKQVKENSSGIKNARERFALLLNAKVEVKSGINEGTKVKITLPKERKA